MKFNFYHLIKSEMKKCPVCNFGKNEYRNPVHGDTCFHCDWCGYLACADNIWILKIKLIMRILGLLTNQ
jgi:hypothetical protein